MLNSINSNLILLFLSGFIASTCECQNTGNNTNKERGDVRVMFYNTENTFDTHNDSLFNDEEFLPESARKWTSARYYIKLTNIFKTIAAIGETIPPEIICLAEVENRKVLQDLLYKTPLEKYPYEIVHYNSPDARGIDVAVLCRKDAIKVIYSEPLKIRYSANSTSYTRDILYLKVRTNQADTINLFINHWPSRREGKKQTESHRMSAAIILRQKVDSLLSVNPGSKIIITGDFNDEPIDKSLTQWLKAKIPDEDLQIKALYDLSGKMQAECNCGTYRYKGNWNMFDQFIISGSLLKKSRGLHTCISCMNIADYNFLLREDKKYGGLKPFSTYQGPQYIGGFSDHLPIYLDLYY
jgi:exonuclease III